MISGNFTAGMKIGVISDTHGFFDPKIPGLFAGVDHILHAGDIGPESVLAALRKIAPVTAVGGNTDEVGRYPATEIVVLDRRKFLVHHIVNPRQWSDEVQTALARERPDAVVFGHTHKAYWARHDGIVFLNPGYAGKTRFGMERSVAILPGGQPDLQPEFITL